MKKRIFSFVLILTLLLGCMSAGVSAFTTQQLNTADALYHLGLFFGTGKSYSLDNTLTRNQGMALLIRMLGKEEESKSYTKKHGFTDVADWAAGYVGYAYTNGLTKGVSKTKFGGDSTMTEQMFLTMTLRALGYSDSAEGEFSYAGAKSFAFSKKLVDSEEASKKLLRADAVEIFWRALHTVCKDGKTLSARLIAQGVFTEAQMTHAEAIRTGGRTAADKTGEQTGRASDAPPKKPSEMTWAEYQALSPNEQAAFRAQMTNDQFKAWREAAQNAGKVETSEISIGVMLEPEEV